MLQLFVEAVELVGIVLLLIGGFFELTGAIGVLRLPNFFQEFMQLQLQL